MAVGNEVPYSGWQSVIGIAPQLTSTTFVTSTCFLEFNSESVKREVEELKLPHIRNSRDFHKRVRTNDSVGGSMEFDLDCGSDAVMYILKAAMGGTASVATISAAVSFTHTFSPGDMETNGASAGSALMRGISVAVRKGSTDTWDSSFCRVNNLTISGEVGSPVVVTAEIVGMSSTVSATMGASAVSYSAVNPVTFAGVGIQTGDSITNVSAEYFTSFELSINNNLDSDARSLGSRNRTQIPVGMREVTLTLGQRYDTLTSFNRFIQNTATAVQIFLDSAQTITSGATTYSMYIDIPETYFNSNQPEVGGAEVITYEANISAIYSSEKSYVTQFRVTNGTSTYDS